jgi:hypothetical protein
MEYKNQKITRKTYFCNSSGPSDAQLISKILPSIKINFAE